MKAGTRIVEVRGFLFQIRENTLDEFVLKEVLTARTYSAKITLSPSDIWLDIGANIGAFTVSIAQRVKRVFCYEPDADNFALLEENLKLNGCRNVVATRAAVVANDRPIVNFYLNTGKNKGAHSLYARRGRERVTVPAVSIASVLRRARPTKIKLDAEGAESELLPEIDLSRIKELIFEYHRQFLKDEDNTLFGEILAQLDAAFPRVRCPRESHAWRSIVWAGA